MTAGKVGLDVHAVAESTRITLDRQLHAFRDDEVGFMFNMAFWDPGIAT